MAKSKSIPVLFVSAALLMLASAAPAFEMSSKRDCAICHVMWLDDFRTDKETLIEWQSGNVLMKDTQGVVSSEDICYSCHDGYVNDSRHVVWKFNSHKTFVKPSGKVTVPVSLPLSNRDELYCGTCHSPHGAGSAPKGGVEGITSFFRIKNVDSSLCEMCHRSEARFDRTNGHPLGVPHDRRSFVSANLQGSEAATNPRIVCQTCHRVHGAKGEKIVVVENSSSALCTDCHQQQKQVLYSKHDLRVTLADSKNIKQQLPDASGPCGACHTPHHATNRKLWAREFAAVNLPSQMCLTCHGQKAGGRRKQVGAFSHPLNVVPAASAAVAGGLPLFTDTAVRDPSGSVQCFTCHDVHRWDPALAVYPTAADVDGDGTNSFLRISSDGLSALCSACHADKNSVMYSDHNLEVTAPDEKNTVGRKPSESGTCGSCHLPHNAMGAKLWAKNRSADSSLTLQMCTACHNPNGAAKAKLVGGNDHPVEVKIGEAATAGELPLYDGEGNKKPDAQIACMTCHEPHRWAPRNTESDEVRGLENREGTAADSFLRRANAPSSLLCSSCHTSQAALQGSAHDMGVSAPAEKNLRDQRPAQSGQCGACHLVHNSPGRIRLWARPLGPVATTANILDSLCTSCHSKGNVAEKKIPSIATHPRERLLINTVLSDKTRGSYTPVFDGSGQRVDVGDIACPSCHDTHRWGFLKEKTASSEKPQPTGASKFLRTASRNTVCVNCHGPEALFRYLYFHQPETRILRTD